MNRVIKEIIDNFNSEIIGELCIDLAPKINCSENLLVAIAHLEESKKDERLNEHDKNNLDMVLNTLEYLIRKV